MGKVSKCTLGFVNLPTKVARPGSIRMLIAQTHAILLNRVTLRSTMDLIYPQKDPGLCSVTWAAQGARPGTIRMLML